MTIPLVPVLEPVPLRGGQPEPEFQEKVVTFLDALPDYSEAQNAQATAMNETAATIDDQAEQVAAGAEQVEDIYGLLATMDLGELTGSSTTSLAIGYGSKAFAATAGKLWRRNMWLEAHSAANPSDFMAGPVTSVDRSTGAVALDVQEIGGSGTFSDWVINATYPGPAKYEAIGSPVATTSGSAWTWTNIPSGYADLMFELNGMAVSGTPALRIETSVDNGANWSTTGTLLASMGADPGQIRVNHYTGTKPTIEGIFGNSSGGNRVYRDGPINALRLSLSTGAGTAGSIQLYGK